MNHFFKKTHAVDALKFYFLFFDFKTKTKDQDI